MLLDDPVWSGELAAIATRFKQNGWQVASIDKNKSNTDLSVEADVSDFKSVNDAVSRIELAQLTCEVFGLDAKLLTQSEPPEDQLFPAAVPVDSSLGNEFTKKVLGIQPQSIREILYAFKTELETGVVTPLTRAE